VFRNFLALSLVRWTWGHAGDAGKVSSKAGMGKIMSNRLTSSITAGRPPCPRSGTPQVREDCSGAKLPGHVIT
jgi:hypothetical protein